MRRLLFRTFLPLVAAVGMACSSSQPAIDAEPASQTDRQLIPIAAIQGEGHRSARTGETVVIEGTVTGVLDRARLHGFWLQDGGARGTGASSGVFVRTRGESGLSVGDSLRVAGRVVEFERPGSLPLTQVDAEEITPVGPRSMPAYVRIGSDVHIPEIVDDDGLRSWDPAEDAVDFWESLEGMLIEIGHATVVGPTTRFGDFVVVPDAEVTGAIRTERGGVLLQPDDKNTERIIVDTSLTGGANAVSVGDTIDGPLRGIVHYDFGAYRLMATSSVEVEARQRPASIVPPSGSDGLTVASYNVLNLALPNDDARFESVAESIVEALGSPDILALQEIQDDTGGEDDGVVAAEGTLRRLADAIVAAGGPRYVWRQIDPLNNADGGAPGSNIRVAFLVNPERVEIIDRGQAGATDEVSIEESADGVRLDASPGRIGTATECFLGEGSSDESEGTRKSLALEVRFRGETYFLINNHLKSKRGDDSIFGAVQPPRKMTESQRTCQAETVASFAKAIVNMDPSANVIVLGDMNEHEFRAPMAAFEQAGLVDMITRIPLEQRYSYNYLGNSQVLDHIFVTPALSTRAKLWVAHINSPVPDGEAASDHDPLLLQID